MIKKAVITSAGLGTRLLTATKEQPKEMLPIYAKDNLKNLRLKPMLQLIFEQIYDFGIRDFCFVIGRGKRVIEDHFTPDYEYLEMLKRKNNSSYQTYLNDLQNFYDKINNSNIFWVNQSKPLGFGHAVLQALPYTGNEDFLLYAGDTLIISQDNNHLKRLLANYEKEKSEIAFLCMSVNDPENYGIVFGKESSGYVDVSNVVEKPVKPTSNLAIMPIYLFKSTIFEHLQNLNPGKGNEIQLTDAIESNVKSGKVIAVKINEDELRLDIGSPETYMKALLDSFNYYK